MPLEAIKDEVKNDISLGKPHNVILFNDEVHSFDEVTGQLIKAIKCTTIQASKFAMKAHSEGQAIVFSGNLERCELVESLLGASPVNLVTSIEKA